MYFVVVNKCYVTRLCLIFLNRKLSASAFLWLIRAQLTQLTPSDAPYVSGTLNGPTEYGVNTPKINSNSL